MKDSHERDPKDRPKEDPKQDEPRSTQHEERPETAEHPTPGVEHKKEPDAENIIPAEDRPGTF